MRVDMEQTSFTGCDVGAQGRRHENNSCQAARAAPEGFMERRGERWRSTADHTNTACTSSTVHRAYHIGARIGAAVDACDCRPLREAVPYPIWANSGRP